MSLAISPSVSFFLNIPHLTYLQSRANSVSRLGDISIALNFATDWFSKYISLNYYLEFNTGSGPEYQKPENHPLEAYGHEEWRTGLIGFKNFKYISLHYNLFYVFRSQGEPTLFGSFFNLETLNIFSAEAWKRALGFNPLHEKTFFYKDNFTNDNLDIAVGVNTDIWSPFVPFVELLVNFYFKDEFSRKAPGSGIMRNQVAVGCKFFLNKDQFVAKLSLLLALPSLSDLYNPGLGFGFYLKF